MKWATNNLVYIDTVHTITVTAYSGCHESKSITYTLSIKANCDSAAISVNFSLPIELGYVIGQQEVSYTLGSGIFSYTTTPSG